MRLGALISSYWQGYYQIKRSECEDWLILGEVELYANHDTGLPMKRKVAGELDGVYEPEPYMRGYYKDTFERSGPLEYYLTRPYQAAGTLDEDRKYVDVFNEQLESQLVVWIREPKVLDAVADDEIVAVRPGPPWDQTGYWCLSGRKVWIIAADRVAQWRAYTEIMALGGDVVGVLVEYRPSVVSMGYRGVLWGSDPYRRKDAPESFSIGDVCVHNVERYAEFWSILCQDAK